MNIDDIVILAPLLGITFVPPIGAAAFVVSRWSASVAERKNLRVTALLGDIRFIGAVGLSLVASFVIPKLTGLDLFTGWALAHGSFIMIWPLMLGLTLGAYRLVRAR